MDSGRPVMDKYIEKILIGTSLRPMTPLRISEIYGIPIATCHRKIHMLERFGLVVCVKKYFSNGNGPIKVYKASEEKVKVTRENGTYIVRVNVSLDIAVDLHRGRFNYGS
jgi:hypothetical protein